MGPHGPPYLEVLLLLGQWCFPFPAASGRRCASGITTTSSWWCLYLSPLCPAVIRSLAMNAPPYPYQCKEVDSDLILVPAIVPAPKIELYGGCGVDMPPSRFPNPMRP